MRKKAAQEKNEALFDVIGKGPIPNYAIIFDRSDSGVDALNRIKRAEKEIGDQLKGSSFQTWDTVASHMEYCVMWRTWGHSGGLTIPSLNLETLLNETLPKVIQHNAEKGGLCSFILAVDVSVQDAITQKIDEIQPTENTSTD